jgi:alkaline phosphatase
MLRTFTFVFLLVLPVAASAQDYLREMQSLAVSTRAANWGHWGPNHRTYSSWLTHSNRLIPLYSFGMNLKSVKGEKSLYRSENRLKELYGFLPEATHNPRAVYFDQTDVYQLQKSAVAANKKCIVLFVFDGMDWHTTQAAAIYKSQKLYTEGRGSGLHFQDFRAPGANDYGFYVTAPHSEGTKLNVDDQKITGQGDILGGYAYRLAGEKPWSTAVDPLYLIGKGQIKHAYPDSAATATSLTTGRKTYNAAINVDPFGRPLMTIAHELQEKKFAVGVVTSVPISHATPACAYARNVSRDDYQDLSRDLLGLPSVMHPQSPLPGVDVLIGAGFGESKDKDGNQGKNFVPGNRYLTDADLKAVDAQSGGKYRVALRTAGKNGAEVLTAGANAAMESKQRFLGYFGGPNGHLPFRTADGAYDPVRGMKDKDNIADAEVYKPEDISENPTLAQMTVAALDVLKSRSDKMWLMVEAGDVDWANHQNNLDASIGAVLSGDDAFKATTDWIEKNVGWENAVVLLTADHGHYLVLDDPTALLAPKAAAKTSTAAK